MDYAATWAKVNNVKCQFVPAPKENIINALGPVIGEEIYSTFVYQSREGYDGGDPDVLRPKDLGIKPEELMGVEKYIRSVDWSSTLNA